MSQRLFLAIGSRFRSISVPETIPALLAQNGGGCQSRRPSAKRVIPTDTTYRRIREALGRRDTFFNDLRALTRYLIFDSWSHLLQFMFMQ